MKHFISLYSCILLLGISSCKKNEQPPVSTEIFGEWIWLYSLGGLTGNQVTKPSIGMESTYKFTRDSLWTQCYNGKCEVPTKFTMRMERSILFGDNRMILTIRRRVHLAQPDTGSVIIKDRYLVDEVSNELHIAQDIPDGFGEFYSRK